MLYLDIPTASELKALAAERGEGHVSIYLRTTPLSQQAQQDRIELHNAGKQALDQLAAANFDKQQAAAISEHIEDLVDDDDFWREQANSLAVFVTAEGLRSFRLPNLLTPAVEVSDRFHLKPLLRTQTFPHQALVLALHINGARLIEVTADLPPAEVRVPDMPKDAASSVNRASVRDRSPSGRIHGSEGQKVLLRQYSRRVDAALRPMLTGRHTPLILAATEPLLSIFPSVNTYPHLLSEPISGSPEHVKDAELASAAHAVLDRVYSAEIAATKALYEQRFSEGRATTDLAQAARAATYGAVDTLLVDMDAVVPGTVNEQDGAVHFAEQASANVYGVIDEIAGRALATGARVLAVRSADIPGGAKLAAIMRYPM